MGKIETIIGGAFILVIVRLVSLFPLVMSSVHLLSESGGERTTL